MKEYLGNVLYGIFGVAMTVLILGTLYLLRDFIMPLGFVIVGGIGAIMFLHSFGKFLKEYYKELDENKK